MQPRSRQVVVAGAGIAGLTAALAFAAQGCHVRLFERSQHLEEVGAGIQLSPNATRLLRRLGVLGLLSPVAVRPEGIAIRKARSLRRLATVPLGDDAEARWGAPYLTVHRADLQSALLALARRHADIDLTTGAAIRDAALHRRGVTLSVDRDRRIEEVRCDLAVGADGVWSTLRGAGGHHRPSRYTGYLAWRSMLRATDAVDRDGAPLLPGDRVTAFLHRRFHLVAYPVRAGRAVNLVAVTKSPAAAERWSNAADRTELARTMRWSAPALRHLVEDSGPWTTWPIHEVPPDEPWTHPAGFVLIGDAAHAMSPYAAQGAAMAIEDAVTLAGLVARKPDDLPGALVAYEALRRGRIGRVAARGRFNRFVWHASGPVALVRDRVLAQRGPARLAADLDWLYGWDPDREIAATS